MAITLNDNIQTNAPKPSDARYLNGVATFTSVADANASIAVGVRHIGLKVNINNVDYWYKDGTANGDLVIYSSGGGGGDGDGSFAYVAATAYHIDDGNSSHSSGEGVDYIPIPVIYAATSGYAENSALLDSLDSLYFLNRANHTGTQLVSTISDLTTNGTAGTAVNALNLNNQNAAFYLNRANHTSTQTTATISDFNTASDARIDLKVSGTSNKIAKFTGTHVVGDSNITDSGSVITLGVDVTASANIQFKQAHTPFQTLTDAATINWNMNNGAMAKVTITDNRTVAAPTNLKDGATYVLKITQDGTGSRTLSWNSVFHWPGAVPPVLTTTPNAYDVATFVCDGSVLIGVLQNNFGS